ncbi:hypothetical protein SAMN05421767_1544 [Granulicatella balaenopterae]|uniref:Uncharacterized protein n=1 Tax=Granulicatella balaenopterae TaxID=137733 RepID=A0A1H9PBR3_9LACT|nr:Cof-type HAD-IIB family hydrolase [Granulicatella balaenopterae]SER45621.1 hypothetical protein SAMN05421767_1544 [Granulicatella balaenopterae]
MQEIKAIALDLDGTLLTSDKKITDTTKKVLQKAQDKGIKIVLCTGRALKGVRPLLEELDLFNEDDVVITYNGGVIQKTKSQEILFQEAHTKEDVIYIHQETMKVNLPMNMLDLEYVYEPTYPTNRASRYHDIMGMLDFVKMNPEDLADDQLLNKAVLCYDEAILDEEFLKLPAEFTERFNCMKSRPILMEVLPKNVNKGQALVHLAAVLGMEIDNIMACGDADNDLDMIREAGFGVAMANATETVKAVADYITTSNNEDGVAKAIEYILEK